MNRRTYRLGWAIALTAVVTMACTCGLLSGLNQAGQSLQTVQAFASQAGEGLLTAQSLATEVATSGVLETVQAFATEGENSPLMQTAQALATQSQGGSVSFGEAPPDIPVMEDRQSFFGSETSVVYTTQADFKTVLAFYKKEMIANGWKEVEGAVGGVDANILYFEKENRTATVSVTTMENQTGVVITIEQK